MRAGDTYHILDPMIMLRETGSRAIKIRGLLGKTDIVKGHG
jgi:hypothetical protein